MKKTKFLLVLIFLGLIISCGKKDSNKENLQKSVISSKGKKSKKEIQEKNSYTEKYNQYVTLSNKIHDVNKQITSYFQDAGENEKLSRNEVPGSGFSLFTPDILPNLKNTIAKTPKIEGLDEKAQRLLTALEKMKPLTDQIQYYYFNDKKYLDDNYKQGKEIHKQISAVYPEYKKSLEDFDTEMGNIQKASVQEYLQEFEKKGYLIQYNAVLIMSLGEEILTEYSRQKLYAGNVTEADISKIKPLYEKLEKALSDFKKFSTDKNQIEKEGFTFKASGGYIFRFTNISDNFSGTVRILIKRVNEKNRIRDYDGRLNYDQTVGTPENANYIFKTLINTYNQLMKR